MSQLNTEHHLPTFLIDQLNSKKFISYYEYVQMALYHKEIGYYIKNRNRVGYDANTDFYTSESLNTNIFQKLIQSSLQFKFSNILNFKKTVFCELGAELDNSKLQSIIKDDFYSIVALNSKDNYVQVFEELTSHNLPLLLFSNELLDAQPFHRVKFINGHWNEIKIQLTNHFTLQEVDTVDFSENLIPFLPHLPKNHIENYIIDIPTGAYYLFESLLSYTWSGGVMFLDYGKNWEDLVYNYPEGTARGYYKHQVKNNILEYPTDMDITCHICWDWCKKLLELHRFQSIDLSSQESFFVKNSGTYIESILNQYKESFSKEKQSLLQLLHPQHMGQKFQVLSAYRQ